MYIRDSDIKILMDLANILDEVLQTDEFHGSKPHLDLKAKTDDLLYRAKKEVLTRHLKKSGLDKEVVILKAPKVGKEDTNGM